MGKVQGYFYGYRQFAVDRNWLREQQDLREQKRNRQFDEWSKKWITVYRLKYERLWTDAAIRKWLGAPQKQGKYNVFAVQDVRNAEQRSEFIEWIQPRIDKKREKNNYFIIKSLG